MGGERVGNHICNEAVHVPEELKPLRCKDPGVGSHRLPRFGAVHLS